MNEELEMSKEEDTEGRIKKHVRKNRKFYIGAGVGLVIGAVAGILLKSKPEVTQFVFKIRGDHNNPSMTYQTISIYGNKVGRPGVAVWDTTTGKRYESISLAAQHLEVPINAIREQLHGRKAHVNGHMFEVA